MTPFIKHGLTGIDGESWDLGRVLWALIGVAFVVFAAWSLLHGGAFDPQNFGVGAGSILGGGGAGVGFKARTEPPKEGEV